jgi:hypothetical protein
MSAIFAVVDIDDVTYDGVTPIRNHVAPDGVWKKLRKNEKRFPHAFEYIGPRNESPDDVVAWCIDRFGPQFRKKKQVDGRWWHPMDCLIVISDPNDAFDFRLRWT